MTMQRLENELRATGDPRDSEYANVVADIHKARGADIPLPTPTVDAVVTVQTPEVPVEIKQFSDEAREALEKQGYIVYGLTGQSIKTQREAGRPFWSTWHNSYPDFEALTSMQSEVAINPSELFLPMSNNKTLPQQEEMVTKFSEELAKKITGVAAIIGQAPDYVELAFQHLDVTQNRLFGSKYDYNYARTKTKTSGPLVALVGYFDPGCGLDVGHWTAGQGHKDVSVAPLVVPV